MRAQSGNPVVDEDGADQSTELCGTLRLWHPIPIAGQSEKPDDPPIEQATKCELTINLETAKAFGLTLAETPIARRRRGGLIGRAMSPKTKHAAPKGGVLHS